MRTYLAITLFLIAKTAFGIEAADKVVVIKSEKMLYLYKEGRVLASVPVVFGANPEGHKQQEGDERTPEGSYRLDFKKPDSAYHKAIHISYPNTDDIASARRRGVSPGGAVMIHGQRNGFAWAAPVMQDFNWTRGCIALSNEDMETVWQSVRPGTPIEIVPQAPKHSLQAQRP